MSDALEQIGQLQFPSIRGEAQTVDMVVGILAPTVDAAADALHEQQVGQEALDRRTEDAELSLGEVDDHLAALRSISRDVLGHEYESAQQIADAIDDAASQLEALL